MNLPTLLMVALVESALQAHYKLWSDTDQTVLDHSGNGNHGYNGSTPTVDANDGIFTARSIKFPSQTRAVIPVKSDTGLGIHIGDKFSFTAWFLPFGFCPLYRRAIQSFVNPSIYWAFQWDPPGLSTYFMGVTLTYPTNYLGQVQLFENKWRYFSIIIDCSTNFQIIGYDNLSVVLNRSCSPYVDDSTYVSAIGGKFCFIYELKIFDHLISLSDIASQLQDPGTGGCPGVCSSPCIKDPKVFCPSPCEYIPDFTTSCSAACPCNASKCIGDCRMCHGTCSDPSCLGTVYFDCPAHSLCHPSCQVCSGPNSDQCVSCYDPNALLASGECICKSGFFLSSSNLFQCSPCHQTCDRCSGATVNDCLSCKFQAIFDISTHTCICEQGTYPSPDSSNCLKCDPSCLECFAAGPTQCSKCALSAYLSEPPPSKCICKLGFFLDSSTCAACDTSCYSCNNSSACLTCRANAEIRENKCVCISGYYQDDSECVKCSANCSVCNYARCVACDNGLFSIGRECVSNCPVGSKLNPSLRSCESGDVSDLQPPTPALVITPDNSLLVTFDLPMEFSIDPSDVSIEVSDPQSRSVPISSIQITAQSANSFTIKLIFEPIWLPANCSLTLTFLFPEAVTSAYGIPIALNSLTGTLFAFGEPPSSKSMQQGNVANQAAATSKAGLSAGIASSVINGSPSSLISLVNQLQLISYLAMTKVNMTSDFAQTLAALNVGLMLPNPLAKIDIWGGEDEGAPEYVRNYGVESTVFVVNSAGFWLVSGVVLSSVGPIILLSRAKIGKIDAMFTRVLLNYRWNIPVTLWLTSYLDLGIFALLQLRHSENISKSVFNGVSIALAAFISFCFIATPVLLTLLLFRNFRKRTEQNATSFLQRWSVLVEPFRPATAIAFYPLFVTRRMILAITLTITYDWLIANSLINSIMSGIVFFFLLVCRPYRNKIDLVEAEVIEGGTLLVYVIAALFSFEISADKLVVIGEIGMWAVRVAIASNVGFALLRTAIAIGSLIKQYRAKVKSANSKYKIREQIIEENTREEQQQENSVD